MDKCIVIFRFCVLFDERDKQSGSFATMDTSNSQRIQYLDISLCNLLQMQDQVNQVRNDFPLTQNDFWILPAKQSPWDKRSWARSLRQ